MKFEDPNPPEPDPETESSSVSFVSLLTHTLTHLFSRAANEGDERALVSAKPAHSLYVFSMMNILVSAFAWGVYATSVFGFLVVLRLFWNKARTVIPRTGTQSV